MNDIGVRIASLARPLRKGAQILEVVAWLGGVAGAIGGIAIAIESSTGIDSFGNTTTTHPYVAAGIAVGCVAVVQAVFLYCIARALNLFAVHIAAVHGVEIDLSALVQTPPMTVPIVSSTTMAVPPGWYPDPVKQGESRYWNGTKWTDDIGAELPPPLASAAASKPGRPSDASGWG